MKWKYSWFRDQRKERCELRGGDGMFVRRCVWFILGVSILI